MRQYASSDRHEKPASRIEARPESRRHMCTEAIGRRGMIKPNVCAECDCPCAYGMKALKILGIPRISTVKPEHASFGDGKALPTLSARIMGVRKERSRNAVYSK